jgi:hypothetical protein
MIRDCRRCGGFGLVYTDTREGEVSELCPAGCFCGLEVVKSPSVRDTVPAPAPDGCEEAS